MNKKEQLRRLAKIENYLYLNKVELKDSLRLADGINVCGLTSLIDISDNFTQVSELQDKFEIEGSDLIKQYAGDDVIHNSVLESLENIDSYDIQDTFESLIKEIADRYDEVLPKDSLPIFNIKLPNVESRLDSTITDFDENFITIKSTFLGEYPFKEYEYLLLSTFKREYPLAYEELFNILKKIKEEINE